MGWKKVREHYGVSPGLIVRVQDGNLMVGTGFVPDVVAIAPDGRIVKRDDRGGRDTGPYQRIQAAVEADPVSFARLFAAADEFGELVPVYTWSGGEIVEKRCEEPGWPNVTTDGEVMYENRFYPTREQARTRAIGSAEGNVEWGERMVLEAEEELARRRAALETWRADLSRLKEDRR